VKKMRSQSKGPKRAQAHITGGTALNTFNYRCPQEWVTNEVKRDYGWDIIVSIGREQRLREDFLVQLKGSGKPCYIDSNTAVAQILKTATVDWLRIKTMPTMLCICDTGRKARPLYWVWLNESLKEIEKKNPDWLRQETITLRVPTAQSIDESFKKQIESYVREFYVGLNISKEIGEVIAPSFQVEKAQVREAFVRDPHEFVQQKVIPLLVDAGVVEPTGEALSQEDQERLRRIKEASAALNNFHDLEAKALLDQMSTEIDAASEGIKARYYNNRGVFAVHNNDLEAAFQCFEVAHKKRPDDPKYAINLLSTRYELITKDSSEHKQLPPDWENGLESVLSKSPDFAPALRLKAYWIGHLKGASLAENLLRNKPLWNQERVTCSVALAEVYMDEGNLETSIALLAETENLTLELDGIYWSVYGLALFRKSLHLIGVSFKNSTIEGPGPREMDIVSMNKACECYAKAFRWFESRGMPRLAKPAISNYSKSLVFLGRYAESEQICKSYLRQHSESHEVQFALAEALFYQQKYVEAIPLMQFVYRAQSTSSTVCKNLALCFFFAEEYEELVNLLKERQATGFTSKDEEGVARSLAAIAFWELGQFDESLDQIKYLELEPELVPEAAITRAFLAIKSGVPKKEAIDIIRLASQERPSNLRLLSHLALNLAPASPENSAEIKASLRKVHQGRQLIPQEFSLLGSALMILGKPEEAEQLFRQALIRYPQELHFLCDRAYALMEIGDSEGAFSVMQVYIKQGQKDYSVLRNMAIIATDTDRLDKAIQLFQMALGKTQDEKEIAEIHCQLYELKKRGRGDPKDIARHAVEYGKRTHGKPEAEARYFAMLFMSPLIPNEHMDAEAREWVRDFQARLGEFSDKYPNYPSFKTMKIPSGLSNEEMRQHFLAQLSEIMLPQYLATVPLQMAVRNQTWPLVFRAQYLPGYHSVFEYWDHCISSEEFGDAIHIFGNVNDLEKESRIAERARAICIDISALLTLAQFELLDALTAFFKQIVITRGTKLILDNNLYDIRAPHPLAQRIETWRLANRSKIRIRNPGISTRHTIDKSGNHGVSLRVKTEHSLDVQVASGAGDLLLAQELGLPFYSDESIFRHWAEKDFQLSTLGTLGFMEKLVTHNTITNSQRTALIAKMIRMNLRTIPIRVSDLKTRLEELIRDFKKPGKLPESQDFLNDDILGTLLKQFGDTTLNPLALVSLAVEWWVSVLFDRSIPGSILSECMEYPSWALSLRTSGGVLSGIASQEQENRAASIWTAFLWRCYRRNDKYVRDAWSALKSTCSRIFPDERKREQLLFELLPKHLGIMIEKDTSLNALQKMSCLVSLPQLFEQDERIKFEKYFIQHKPKFFL